MNDCNLCRYIRNQNDPTKQSCSKWVLSDDFDTPCNKGENPGDPPLTLPDSDCQPLECPGHCQYPYTKQVYNDEDHPSEHYDNLGENPAFRYLNNNSDALELYLNNATNNDMIKESLRSYNAENVPENLNLICGDLLTPEGEDSYDFPDLPTSDVLRQTIEYNVNNLNNGIDWSAIKRTDLSVSELNIQPTDTSVVINDYTIPVSDSGIELEWWTRTQLSNDQLKAPLPVNLRGYDDILENIHRITGGTLEYVFPGHTVGNMVIEQIYDWLMKNNLQRQGDGGDTPSEKFTMSQFFGISTDDVTNRDFETCMNQLLMTEHDDDEYLRRINTYTHLTDLGDPNNRKDLLYVEAKIIKFLVIEPSDIGDCLDIVYLTDEVCEIGLTSNPTQMMGKFLKMNTDNVDDEKYDDKMRLLTKKLLKYLPDIIKKIIDISEYYENQKCNDELHKNTKLLKEIYSSLFTQNSMKIDMPNLGIGDFFKDFEENIYTKIILLIFIAYVVTQFIRLFTVNLNLTGGK